MIAMIFRLATLLQPTIVVEQIMAMMLAEPE